jgi:flagellar hook-associated protein 3 FlgL
MMRITQQLLTNQIRQNSGRASDRLNRAIQEIQSDTSVPSASVDPVKATRIAGLDERLRNHESLSRSRSTMRSHLGLADTALGNLTERISAMRDQALSVVTDSASDEDRKIVGTSLRKELEAILGIANTRDGSGRYIFGGLQDAAPPFAADGTYNGDNNSRDVEISPGIKMPATVSGHDLFGPLDGGVGPANETIAALSNLVAALETGDEVTARNQLNPMAKGLAQLVQTRANVGGRLATLENLDMLGLDIKTTLASERGDETAVDIARLSSELAGSQASLQAIIETSKTLMAQSSGSWLNG